MHIFKLNEVQKSTNTHIANYMQNVPFDMFCFGEDVWKDGQGHHMKKGSNRGSVSSHLAKFWGLEKYGEYPYLEGIVKYTESMGLYEYELSEEEKQNQYIHIDLAQELLQQAGAPESCLFDGVWHFHPEKVFQNLGAGFYPCRGRINAIVIDGII